MVNLNHYNLWQDTIMGCQAEYSPYLKKNGQWISFADDSVYQFYQKVLIEFLPVILAPRNTESSLNDNITKIFGFIQTLQKIL